MKTMCCAVVVGILAFANAGEAKAAPYYPWCSHAGGMDYGGAISCGFMTWEQCMATVSGMGGSCDRNVNPPPAPARASPTPRVRKRDTSR